MTSQEIRQSFLNFFVEKGHSIVESAPVIPFNDPTLLFTNAGMNQFKDVFLGVGNRSYSRAVDTQKCIRVSGKHNDLEEVGRDTYHHTFFEMLGNWSFGDYYKQEAIEWAFELLTKVWKLDVNRLHATVYRTDDEAFEIWKKYLPLERIHRFDEKDNFWEMGETGPCGPCSEIHYDNTADLSGASLVNAGTPAVIEIWNLVFIQYNRKQDGTLEPLTAKHVDTGMGFERICAVIQGKSSNYETDVFTPLINEIAKLSKKEYSQQLEHTDSIAMRVIADHVRTLSFAIADGALPSNEGRGYVLRRILRRASRFARNIGFREPVIFSLVHILTETMGEVFPELRKNQNTIERVIRAEEESFLQTLERGLDKFEQISEIAQKEGKNIISGSDAFLLYDSFGFPLDLTELIARENNFSVDISEFNEKMKEQKERSRKARKQFIQEVEQFDQQLKSEFIGYTEMSCEANVLFIKDNQIVFNQTPFYAESGGQVADTGCITLAGEKYEVTDVKKIGDAILHFCDRDIEQLVGAKAFLEVDEKRRKDVMRNHSATHLLHEALYEVLGSHIKQAGSLVAPDYLRFDFNHFEKCSLEELEKVEKIVNEKILDGISVQIEEIELEEAKKYDKIKMFFGDKYGDRVRVVKMDPKFSMELCGGTHVKNTADISFFKIISESSIAAGVRRIEAITGKQVQNYIADLHNKIEQKANEQQELLEKIKHLEKELNSLKMQEVGKQLEKLIENAIKFGDIRIIATEILAEDLDQMRNIAENLRNSLSKNGIALLSTILNEKVQLVCTVTDDLTVKYPASKLVLAAAKQLGGGGGGKPHLATAGGKEISKLPDLLKNFADLVKEM